MKFFFWGLIFIVFPAMAQQSTSQEDELRINDSFTVKRQVVDVRVLDRRGRPITGLTGSDFILTQNGEKVPILSCQWVGSPTEEAGQSENAYPGRLVLLFFQVGLNSPRVAGVEKKVNQGLSAITSLDPNDRVAVLSYDSHLKLWCDFTGSPARVAESLRQALRRDLAPYPKPMGAPSLAAVLDQLAGKKARSPEMALALIGRALEPFECAKTLIYLDFDGSDYGRDDFRLRRDYPLALKALNNSRTTVIGLDFSPYEYDTLGLSIRQLAEDTGGFFSKTPTFFQVAVAQVEHTLSGYYSLSHDVEAPIDPEGRFKLKLDGIRGRILARSPYNSWGDGMTRPKPMD